MNVQPEFHQKETVVTSDKKRLTLQILNVASYVVAMVISAFQAQLCAYSQTEIADIWNPDIMPAGWAFAIWGIIFSLIGVFVVYQALPKRMIPSRNEQLIFEDIGYIFSINMVTLPVWLLVWGTNTKFGFTTGLVVILAMLVTGFMMMRSVVRAKVNAVEFIGMRIAFSMYTGWVNAATFINVIIMFKSYGAFSDPTGFEQTYTIINLWVAFVLYNFLMAWERNPIYGAVFIWALFAIKDKVSGKVGLDSLYSNLEVLVVAHCVTVGLFGGFLVVAKILGKRFANWDHGILY